MYLADMMFLRQEVPQVYNEFMAGNFVVKETEGLFNQVSTDMALEHVNKLCKVAGGIVGITRSKPALERWMLTCCDLSRLSEDIRNVVGLSSNRQALHKDATGGRMARDEDDVKQLQQQLQQFNQIGRNTEDLVCISTNDVALPEIRKDLLSAKLRGRVIVGKFINDCLGQNPVTNFRDKLPQTKSKTFAALHLSHITTSTGQ